ncbi:MAG: response regulator [Candidatus Nitrosocosmicus sp.]|nr:response regulator [Candidatus Nitrosocosmicus sp.]MDN5868086.1 response regulator [Candidatus Nitrosocosmicus sp.]
MLDSPSIIVVDDERELLSLFKEFLTMEGYTVIAFTDPILAFEYYQETFDKHSLIITDLRMPSMCGIELAKRIREMNEKIKVF